MKKKKILKKKKLILNKITITNLESIELMEEELIEIYGGYNRFNSKWPPCSTPRPRCPPYR